MDKLIYIYKKCFGAVYVFPDHEEFHANSSLGTICSQPGNKSFVRVRKYILNIECIKRIQGNNISMNNGIVLKLNNKDILIIRYAVHNYFHHIQIK